MSRAGCVARDCDHMTRVGGASVDSDTAGTWRIWWIGSSSSTTGTGGRAALEESLRRHGVTLRGWRSIPAGYDEIRTLPAASGGHFRGHVPVSQDVCETWARDWSHAPD